MKPLAILVAGAALAVAVLVGMYHWLGPKGLVFAMPLVGLLGKPLLDVLAGYPRLVSRIVMRKVEGRYVEYRGKSLDVHTDSQARCWVCTRDLRKLVSLPTDAVLRNLAPQQCGELGDPLRWRITVEGLAQVLARSKDPDVTRLCHWLEVDVARPARNRLERGPLVG